MNSRILAGVMLFVASAVAPPTLAQTEGTPPTVAEFVFTAGGSFSFGSAEVVGVKISETMNKSSEHKVLSIELRPEKLLQWERMNEPNAGHELSYSLCGKVMGKLLQQSHLLGSSSMILPSHEVEWAKAVLLGEKSCPEGD